MISGTILVLGILILEINIRHVNFLQGKFPSKVLFGIFLMFLFCTFRAIP